MSRQRYEKEIEEILERAGGDAPPQPGRNADVAPVPRRRSPGPGRRGTIRPFGLKYQYLLLTGIGLIAIGAIFYWLYFFFAGVALLVAGYVMYYRSPRGSQSVSGTPRQRMWRGRSIDPDDPSGR